MAQRDSLAQEEVLVHPGVSAEVGIRSHRGVVRLDPGGTGSGMRSRMANRDLTPEEADLERPRGCEAYNTNQKCPHLHGHSSWRDAFLKAVLKGSHHPCSPLARDENDSCPHRVDWSLKSGRQFLDYPSVT